MFSQPSAAAALTLVWAENASQDLLSVFSSWLHSVRCWGVALFHGRPRTPLGGSPSYLTLNSGFGYSWVCWRSMKIPGRWRHLVRVVEVFGVLIYHVSLHVAVTRLLWICLVSSFLIHGRVFFLLLFHPGWTRRWYHPLSYGLIFFWILIITFWFFALSSL